MRSGVAEVPTADLPPPRPLAMLWWALGLLQLQRDYGRPVRLLHLGQR